MPWTRKYKLIVLCSYSFNAVERATRIPRWTKRFVSNLKAPKILIVNQSQFMDTPLIMCRITFSIIRIRFSLIIMMAVLRSEHLQSHLNLLWFVFSWLDDLPNHTMTSYLLLYMLDHGQSCIKYIGLFFTVQDYRN